MVEKIKVDELKMKAELVARVFGAFENHVPVKKTSVQSMIQRNLW